MRIESLHVCSETFEEFTHGGLGNVSGSKSCGECRIYVVVETGASLLMCRVETDQECGKSIPSITQTPSENPLTPFPTSELSLLPQSKISK